MTVLRTLEKKDAPFMLEWMKDEEVTRYLQIGGKEKDICDCIAFIESSRKCVDSVHMAIVDETDEYQGTVSLKDINREAGYAEFAIVMRGGCMGRGAAKEAMKQIMQYAFKNLKLDRVYWNVLQENTRAIRLYNKMGNLITTEIPKELCEKYAHLTNLLWYVVKK